MDTCLSKNFRRSEFECRCCGEILLSPMLLDSLQDLRDKLGMPIRILSGFRCHRHNENEGGSPTSRHLTGSAADIYWRGIQGWRDSVSLLETLPRFLEGGIGVYPDRGIIHVDVRDSKGRWGFIKTKKDMVSIEDALVQAETKGVRR